MPNNAEDFEAVLRYFATNVIGTKWSVSEFWHSVLNYLSEIDLDKLYNLFQSRVLEFLCQFLLKSLLEIGCHDYDLVLIIMAVVQRCRNDFVPFRRQLILNANMVVEPLFNPDRREFRDRYYMDLNLNAAIHTPDVKFTEALVHYGMIQPMAVGMDQFLTLASVKWFVQNFYNQEQDVSVMSIGRDTFTQYCKGYYSEGPKCGRFRDVPRLCLIVHALQATLMKMKEKPSSYDFVECLNLYQSAMTDPFVSEDEIREVVLVLFRREDYKEDVAARFTNVYRSLFHPQVSTYFRPRSLQHLCRCAVRTTLTSKPNILPDMVNTLPVPTVIKNFLLGAPERRYY